MIRLINELKKAVRLMVGKCIIEAASKASDGVNADIMLLGNERHYGLRLMQHYGFSSVPNADSEGVALFVGGARDNGVVVASQGDASKIPALEKGEVALFSEFGQSIVLKKKWFCRRDSCIRKRHRVQRSRDFDRRHRCRGWFKVCRRGCCQCAESG